MPINFKQFFQQKDKVTGLALGGGAALGAAHIGVLKALEEKEIKPDTLSGITLLLDQ